MPEFVLDTNVIGNIAEERIPLEVFTESDDQFYMTHIQEDELGAYGGDEFRRQLLDTFTTLEDDSRPTESLVLGISKLGRAKLGGGGPSRRIRDRLPDQGGNDIKDGLIAEVAVLNDCTFVTEEHALIGIMKDLYPEHIMAQKEFFDYIGWD